MDNLSNIKPGSHIHLMGICGTAMASLAGLLKDRGFKVTGSDSNPYPPMSTQLESLGIEIKKPYQASNLHPVPDMVIVGNVISANNPEAEELKKLGIPFTSLPKAMGEFIIADRQSVVIAGTHGKTTTTSLMSWVAQSNDKKPGFLIGGIPKNFSKSFQNPAGDWFVIEGDEYDTAYFDKVPKFVHYRPRHVILTSVEFDHADIYKDLTEVKASFYKLMELIPITGTLLWCAEDKNVLEIQASCQVKNKFSYGLQKGDYQAQILDSGVWGTEFRVNFRGSDLGVFKTQMVGGYNILNALAVIGLSHSLGWDMGKVQSCLPEFLGVKRRQEIIGEPDQVTVVEDFAHHPTAVRETLVAIQNQYKDRKVFAIFEPRSATSRRKVFQKDYVEAFKQSQKVIIAKAFDQSKIDEGSRFSSEELVADLQSVGVDASCLESADSIVQKLISETKPQDVVLIMSNGGFDGIYEKLLKGLKQRELSRNGSSLVR